MQTSRYMDEIDAARAGEEWLAEVRKRRCSDAPSHVQWVDLHRHDNGVKMDGGMFLLWGYAGRLVAQYTVVRDDANFSVLTCIEIGEPPARDCAGHCAWATECDADCKATPDTCREFTPVSIGRC